MTGRAFGRRLNAAGRAGRHAKAAAGQKPGIAGEKGAQSQVFLGMVGRGTGFAGLTAPRNVARTVRVGAGRTGGRSRGRCSMPCALRVANPPACPLGHGLAGPSIAESATRSIAGVVSRKGDLSRALGIGAQGRAWCRPTCVGLKVAVPRAPWVWVVALGLAGILVGSPGWAAGQDLGLPKQPAVDYVADLVGRTFVRAFFDGVFEEVEPLVADTVSFDGVSVQGAAVKARLVEAQKRAVLHGRPRKVVTLPYEAAKARFGTPPARLTRLGLEGSVVTFVRLSRGGLIVVLKRVGGRWKVVALSD